jgi:hypothetical protein
MQSILSAIGALIFCWPALFNGFPYFYMDSFVYLTSGGNIVGKLAGTISNGYYGHASPFYSLFLYLLAPTTTVWTIPLAQGLALSYVLLHCFRIFLPQSGPIAFLVCAVLVSITTSVSWLASLVMPDIFLSIMILTFFLVTFCREELSKPQIIVMLVIAVSAILFHPSHLALAMLIVVIALILLLLYGYESKGNLMASLIILITPVLVACLLMIGMSKVLYQKNTLFPQNMPYLLAKSLEDGPGMVFLKHDCDGKSYAICSVADQVPEEIRIFEFFWDDNSIMQTASPEFLERVKDEELEFVVQATLQYPLQQFTKSLLNFLEQLFMFNISFTDEVGESEFVKHQMEKTFPDQFASFAASGQYRRNYGTDSGANEKGLGAFDNLHIAMAITSVFIVGIFLILAFSEYRSRLKCFAVFLLLSVMANAAVAGILSQVHGRYQARVTWLLVIPLFFILAGVCLNREEPAS